MNVSALSGRDNTNTGVEERRGSETTPPIDDDMAL